VRLRQVNHFVAQLGAVELRRYRFGANPITRDHHRQRHRHDLAAAPPARGGLAGPPNLFLLPLLLFISLLIIFIFPSAHFSRPTSPTSLSRHRRRSFARAPAPAPAPASPLLWFDSVLLVVLREFIVVITLLLIIIFLILIFRRIAFVITDNYSPSAWSTPAPR
jgi:hypothetical protein